MNILLIGSGGREHALAWAISASPLCDRLFVAPGNPGTGQIARNLDLKVTDHAAVIAFCRAKNIGLVVVGPEAPLVAGLADDLAAAGIKCFGPKKFPAQLEGSKGFTKDICAKYNIPTAAYGRFRDKAAALAYLDEHGAPIVINAGRGRQQVAEDILAALDSGELHAATLDVFTVEPLPEDSPLWTHPRVILTPHIAASASRRAKARQVALSMAQWQAGQALDNCFDRVRGY